jgi:hypothetical protein
MSQTTVGKLRCEVGKDNDRPFVVEWDSTDLASFESKAQRDLVFVKVDGCNLKVLDCRDDGIPGKYGSYDATRWTSGSVEGFDIKNEGELYAKLPLGAVSLAGQVQAGNQLHLKYFVSGTTPALRNTVYRGDVKENALCKDATHFVAGFDLGAFEVTTSEHNAEKGEVGFQALGGGASHSHEQSHLKNAGKLDDCTAETAKELSRCKVPIRLALRSLTDGDNPSPPQNAPVVAPPVPTGPTAGMSVGEQVTALLQTAVRKMQLKDGNGCLIDLDRMAGLDATAEKRGNNAMIRAQCEMLAGKCDQGKKRYRLALGAAAPQLAPDELDRAVSLEASKDCGNNQGTPAEKADRWASAIIQANFKHDKATCLTQGNALAQLLPTWSTKDEDEQRQRDASIVNVQLAAKCLAREGGECSDAARLYGIYVDLFFKRWPARANQDQVVANMKKHFVCPEPKP